MKIFNFYKVKSKTNAVKLLRYNIFIYYAVGALFLFLFLFPGHQLIFIFLGASYLISAYFLKNYMCKTAAILITIISLLMSYLFYGKDIINFPLTLVIVLISIQNISYTLHFHKKIEKSNG